MNIPDKHFGSKFFFVQSKILGPEKILVPKNFGSQKYLGDHLVGCASIVKGPYSFLSLTLEVLKHDVCRGLEGILVVTTSSFWDFPQYKIFFVKILCSRKLWIHE